MSLRVSGSVLSQPGFVSNKLRWTARTFVVLVLVVFATATVQSCKATRNKDGSVRIEFAPDMVITAYGLEDALHQLIELLGHCMDGSWNRPCKESELEEIGKAIEKVINKKANLARPDSL